MLARTPKDPTRNERKARCLERQRQGLAVLDIVVNELTLCVFLLEHNYISSAELEARDRAAIQNAASVAVADLIEFAKDSEARDVRFR